MQEDRHLDPDGWSNAHSNTLMNSQLNNTIAKKKKKNSQLQIRRSSAEIYSIL